MTDQIDTSPEAVERLLDGVTPGPWKYRPNRFDDWGVVKSDDFHLCQVRDLLRYTMEHLNEARAANYDPWESNARFIAAARQLVPALSAERDRLTAENAALREVLTCYADQFCEGFCNDLPERGTYDHKMDLDCSGCKARAALAASQPRKTDTNGG